MTRERVDIAGEWRFVPDPYREGVAGGYWAGQHDDRAWGAVRVPCGFEACAAGLETYEGAGWFRRAADVPAAWEHRRVVLRFEGVNHHARVWVNGECVGEHADSFLPFELPVDEVLRYGGANTIAVLVDNERSEGEIPAPLVGWRSFGGILREAALVATSRMYLAGVTVSAEPAGDGGTFAWRATVASDREGTFPATVSAEVVDGRGRVLGGSTHIGPYVSAGETAELGVTASIDGVEPWSPDRPTLYTARFTLHSSDGPMDRLDVRFGFRRIEVDGCRLLLNGRCVFLTGFNRHEDSPRTGMATDLAQVREDLLAMKRAGANFVRLCHYPHHGGELDLCDELGLLAMCEVPLYWWRGLAEGAEASERTLAAARRQLATMIRRDVNHPSVAFWSVSNETHEQHADVAAGNAELIRLARRLDPTRLAVHVSDHWRDHPHFDADDVVCVNHYPTWGGRLTSGNAAYDPAESTRDWRDALARLHEAYPDKPILVTEFGYPCLEGVHAGPMAEEVQAAAIEAEFAAMDAPYVCGATVWCYADHPWPERDFIKRLTTSPFGVVTRQRKKLAAFETLARLFGERQRRQTQ